MPKKCTHILDIDTGHCITHFKTFLDRNLGLESLPFQVQVREISSETILDWVFDMIIDLRKPEDVRQVIDAAREQYKKVSL